MDLLLPLAAKSLLIAGATLLLLKLMHRRSAADRSFIAHLGLASIAILPLAFLLLPQLEVAAPWLGTEPQVQMARPAATTSAKEVVSATATFPGSTEGAAGGGIDWLFWGYAAPAAVLLLLTLIALLRLVLLKAKASVLVEANWLTALARAQRRMGFKHGTALLTSDELRSPISWGLMRPVILLNSEAAEAHSEAEAIIAHELAHVARLDWLKLLLSRVTVAMFWYNPLVWLLAREAHQLREEAADDAVLGSDIEDTEYARLLVGIARHECRGLLIGAHGVAPGRTSLARRVRRVLDAASERAPGGWRWTAAAGFFAAGMVVPLATLQLVPMTPAAARSEALAAGGPQTSGAQAAAVVTAPVQSPLGATTPVPVAGAVAVVPNRPPQDLAASILQQPNGASISTANGKTVLRSPDGGTITIFPPDRSGHRRAVLRAPNGATISFDDASAVPGLAAAAAAAPRPARTRDSAIDRAAALKAIGASPEYARQIRSAAPHLRLDDDDVLQLAALRVSPAYLRDLAASGYRGLSADDIAQARAIGVDGAYIRGMSAAGYAGLSMDDLVELRAVGVTPADVARFRRAHRGLPSVDQMVEAKTLGLDPEDLEPDPDR